jgi:predicted TIM-barrel enzyme
MIHLAGEDPVSRAMDELEIFEKEGLTGAIIENYHGTIRDVEGTLETIAKQQTKLVIGINILPNQFAQAFFLAEKYNAKFIQLDHVAGTYISGHISNNLYTSARGKFQEITVLGGVWPKYYTPIPDSDLQNDLETGMKRADAIVVTGEGTGQETPLEKIVDFRTFLGMFPLLIGAGLNSTNAHRQLAIADGAIVGTAFKKDNDTLQPVDPYRVHDLMDVVRQIRTER